MSSINKLKQDDFLRHKLLVNMVVIVVMVMMAVVTLECWLTLFIQRNIYGPSEIIIFC